MITIAVIDIVCRRALGRRILLTTKESHKPQGTSEPLQNANVPSLSDLINVRIITFGAPHRILACHGLDSVSPAYHPVGEASTCAPLIKREVLHPLFLRSYEQK